MAKIQKPLPGLAKFLGIETQGLLRLDALGSCQPVLEIEDYLGPNFFVIESFALNAVGDRESFQCPSNEFWRLKAGAIFFDNQSFNRSAGLNMEALIGGVTYNIPLSASVSVLNGSEGGQGFILDKWNVQPTWSIGVQRHVVVGGPVTGHYFYQYQKLDL